MDPRLHFETRKSINQNTVRNIQKLSCQFLQDAGKKKTEVNTKFIHWPALDHLDIVADRIHVVFIVLKVTFSELTCGLEF